MCVVACDKLGTGLTIENIPAFGLTRSAVFMGLGILVGGVNLHGQIVLGIDHFKK